MGVKFRYDNYIILNIVLSQFGDKIETLEFRKVSLLNITIEKEKFILSSNLTLNDVAPFI